jgi:DNA-binding response OmpR family regulator
MNDFPKVVVVDDGERHPDRAISAELAELGYASVTASLEAADDVLALIPSPAAVLLQLPLDGGDRQRPRFLELARRLRARKAMVGVPVIVVDPRESRQSGGYGALLQNGFAPALAKPDY